MTAGTSGYCQRTKLVHCADGDAQEEKSTPQARRKHTWRQMLVGHGPMERDPDMSSDRAQPPQASRDLCAFLPACGGCSLERCGSEGLALSSSFGNSPQQRSCQI